MPPETTSSSSSVSSFITSPAGFSKESRSIGLRNAFLDIKAPFYDATHIKADTTNNTLEFLISFFYSRMLHSEYHVCQKAARKDRAARFPSIEHSAIGNPRMNYKRISCRGWEIIDARAINDKHGKDT